MSAIMHKLAEMEWDALQGLAPLAKAECFNLGSRPFHVLMAQQFTRPMLEELGAMATRIRQIAKSKTGMDFLRDLLAHRTAMLYFSQPSTRTFLSLA